MPPFPLFNLILVLKTLQAKEKGKMGSLVHKTIYFVVLVLLCYAQVSSAEIYTVGDRNGWIPRYDYVKWINGRTFAVGDTLVFKYFKPQTVAEVYESAAETCDGSNPIFFSQNMETHVRLNTAGDHYFISTGPGDCQNGMNMKITAAL